MNGKLMMLFGSKVTAVRDLAHDLIFPKRCLSCHEFDDYICDKCLDLLEVKNNFCCPICNREMVIPNPCSNCANESIISGLWVVSDYDNELVQKIIHLIKYNYCDSLSEVWKKLVDKYFEKERFWPESALLVPVPLHRRRYLERGFNQSMLVCEILSEIKGNTINNQIIERKNYGQHQAKLNPSKRKENIINCFRIADKSNWQKELGKEIILVDDVYTTGATMTECARTLKKAGFEKIYGFAMARG